MSKRQYNKGRWTKAKFEAFVRNGLRALSYKWPPRYEAKKAAQVKRGVYKCIGYKRKSHECTTRQIQLDHIKPVIEVSTGHTTWDKYVNRLFCEEKNFQVLCKPCHKRKTKDDRR